MCEAIYLGSTKQTFKKIRDNKFYNLLHLLKKIKNQTLFLTILNITLILLRHVHTYTNT